MREEARLEAILEEVRSQYRAIKEGLDNLQGIPARLENIERDVALLKIKMDTMAPSLKNLRLDSQFT